MKRLESEKLTNANVLRVFNGCLSVDGKPYVVNSPDGTLESVDSDGNLVTRLRGQVCRTPPDQIVGYWA